MCLGRTFRRRKRKTKPENETLPCIFYECFEKLSKWMGENGYKPSRKLFLRNFKDSGRGLMTKQTIKPGELIISVPINLLVTTYSVLNSELGIYFEKFFPEATGHQILTIFLMCEKLKAQASRWHPYIHSLPLSYSIPAYFGHNCLIFLPGFLNKLALKQILDLEDSYNYSELLIKNLESNFSFLRGGLDFKLFKWAWCTVNTRCIFVECVDKKFCKGKLCKYHQALAPFLDLLNHSPEVQVETKVNLKNHHFEIKSMSCFKKYDQVYINYGSHDNAVLLLEYGFLVSGNRNDSVHVSLEDIIRCCEKDILLHKQFEERKRFILQKELSKNSMVSCDGLSWNLTAMLTVLTSDQNIRCCNSWFSSIIGKSPTNENYNVLVKKVMDKKIKELNFMGMQIERAKSSPYSELASQVLLFLSLLEGILNSCL